MMLQKATGEMQWSDNKVALYTASVAGVLNSSKHFKQLLQWNYIASLDSLVPMLTLMPLDLPY